MGLYIAALHSVFFLYEFVQGSKVLLEKLAYGLSPVPEEAFALLRTFKDDTGEYRIPQNRVITSSLCELFAKAWSPVLMSRLVAVYQHITDSFFSESALHGLLVHVKITAEVSLPCILVELVHFQTSSFRRCRMILLACQRCSDTVYHPSAFGRFPYESSVFYLVGKINDCTAGCIICTWCRIKLDVMRRAETGLFFNVIDPCFRIYDEFRNFRILRIRPPFLHRVVIGTDRILVLETEMLCSNWLEGYCLTKSISDRYSECCGEIDAVVADLE